MLKIIREHIRAIMAKIAIISDKKQKRYTKK